MQKTIYNSLHDQRDDKGLVIRREGEYHEQATNGAESNVSQPHLTGAAVSRQILPVGGEDRFSLDYRSTA